MIRLPPELTEKIKFFCEEKNFGMAQVTYEDKLTVLTMGNLSFGANEVAILAAHLLLGGVITGEFSGMNDEKLKAENEEKESIQ